MISLAWIKIFSFFISSIFVFFLFVYADGKEEQIKAATLAMQVSRSWDLAACPRTILLFFNPQNEGIREGKTRKKHNAQTLALRMTNLEQYLS